MRLHLNQPICLPATLKYSVANSFSEAFPNKASSSITNNWHTKLKLPLLRSPTFSGPELASFIAIVFYELLEFTIRHCSLADRKRGNFNFVCQLFVIEDEALFGKASENEFAAGYLCVAGKQIGWLR